MKEKWVVSHSLIQGSYHVEPLDNYLESNIFILFSKKIQPQFSAIAIFDTQDECYDLINTLNRLRVDI